MNAAEVIPQLERVKVVLIRSGKVEDMLVEPSSMPEYPPRLWRTVNKNGSIPGNRRAADGHLANPQWPHRQDYALYNVIREAQATALRENIDRVERELSVATQMLLDCYKEEAADA